MTYRFADLVVASSLRIPELLPCKSKRHHCAISLAPPIRAKRGELDWFSHWPLPDGRTWASFARGRGGYLLRFPGKAEFLIASRGTTISCSPKPNLPGSTFRHLLLDQVLPLALSLTGRLVLHAAAVLTAKGVVAFLGVSGQGKSTLAAALTMRGLPLITDDCLLIKDVAGMPFAIPSYPGLRLWSDSISALYPRKTRTTRVAHYNLKRRVSAGVGRVRFSHRPARLARIYVLDPVAEPTDPKVVTCLGKEALFTALKFAFHLDHTDNSILIRQFEALTKFSVGRLVRRLAFHQTYSGFGRILDVLQTDLAS